MSCSQRLLFSPVSIRRFWSVISTLKCRRAISGTSDLLLLHGVRLLTANQALEVVSDASPESGCLFTRFFVSFQNLTQKLFEI